MWKLWPNNLNQLGRPWQEGQWFDPWPLQPVCQSVFGQDTEAQIEFVNVYRSLRASFGNHSNTHAHQNVSNWQSELVQKAVFCACIPFLVIFGLYPHG